MSSLYLVLFILAGGCCVPIDEDQDKTVDDIAPPQEVETEEKTIQEPEMEENTIQQPEIREKTMQERNLADTPQSNQKNPVQEWFESASKNFSTGAQNTMNTLSDLFSKAAQAASAAQQNTPTMYMGSFQLLKMPMPQMSDAIKGMGDLATFAQNFNKLTGGSLPFTQNIPLLSQG